MGKNYRSKRRKVGRNGELKRKKFTRIEVNYKAGGRRRGRSENEMGKGGLMEEEQEGKGGDGKKRQRRN